MTVVTDDFNRANGNLIDGSDWADPGVRLPWVEIVDNQITSDANGGRCAEWVGSGTWGRQQSAELEVGADHTNTDGQMGGPAVYVSENGFYALECWFDSGVSEERFQTFRYDSDGTGSIIGNADAADRPGLVLSPGDTIRIEAEDDGNGDTLLTVYQNDVQIYDVVDDSANVITSGVPGVHVFDTSTRFDNFEANDFASMISDDFSRADQDLDSSADWGDPGLFSDGLVVSSNQVAGSVDGAEHVGEWDGDGSWETHQESEVVVGGDNLAEGMGGPAVFLNAGGFYWGGPDYSNSQYRIMRYNTSTDSHTLIDSAAWGSAPTSGTTITLEVQMVSNHPELTLSVDSSSVASGTDSSSGQHTEGDVGIYISSDGIHFSSWAGDDFASEGVDLVAGEPFGIDDVGAQCDASLDAENGTIYAVATTSSTAPDIAQVKAGQDHNGDSAPYSASQAYDSTTFHAETLSVATTYWFHLMHEGDSGGQSAVATSSSFTTTGASVTFRITDKDDTVVASETSVAWWARPDRDSAPTDSGTSETTDASGEISIDLPNSTKTSGETVVVDVVLDDGRYGVFEATVG